MERNTTNYTYILVHGAWHGAWCWRKLTPLLAMAGHRVVTLDLPGLGQDTTPLAGQTFAACVERVVACVDRAAEPVVLVGHSLGGMTISQVAEERPEKIRWLVYVTALLPCPGETALTMQSAPENQGEQMRTCMEMDEYTVRLKRSAARELFYHDCPPADVRFAEKWLKPQALQPLTTAVTLSERFARVPRAYIGCRFDRVIAPQQQIQMYNRTPCRQVFWLPSGHSPFFAVPKLLASQLQSVAQQEKAFLPEKEAGAPVG